MMLGSSSASHRRMGTVKIAVVGSGRLTGSNLVREVIYKSLRQFMPELVMLFPGHESFNRMVKEQAARLSLSVEHLRPPPPFWVGACLQSVRKGLARGVYAKAMAQDADIVLAFKMEGRPGSTFAQLIEAAKESVVLTIRPCGEETLSTNQYRRPGVLERNLGIGSGIPS